MLILILLAVIICLQFFVQGWYPMKNFPLYINMPSILPLFQIVYGVISRLFHSRLPGILDLIVFPPHLWQCSLSHRCQDLWCRFFHWSWAPLYLLQLWFSVMVYLLWSARVLCCQQQLVIYAYKEKIQNTVSNYADITKQQQQILF